MQIHVKLIKREEDRKTAIVKNKLKSMVQQLIPEDNSRNYTYMGMPLQLNYNYYPIDIANCYTPQEDIKYVCNYEIQIDNEDEFRITKRIIGNNVSIINNK